MNKIDKYNNNGQKVGCLSIVTLIFGGGNIFIWCITILVTILNSGSIDIMEKMFVLFVELIFLSVAGIFPFCYGLKRITKGNTSQKKLIDNSPQNQPLLQNQKRYGEYNSVEDKRKVITDHSKFLSDVDKSNYLIEIADIISCKNSQINDEMIRLISDTESYAQNGCKYNPALNYDNYKNMDRWDYCFDVMVYMLVSEGYAFNRQKSCNREDFVNGMNIIARRRNVDITFTISDYDLETKLFTQVRNTVEKLNSYGNYDMGEFYLNLGDDIFFIAEKGEIDRLVNLSMYVGENSFIDLAEY